MIRAAAILVATLALIAISALLGRRQAERQINLVASYGDDEATA